MQTIFKVYIGFVITLLLFYGVLFCFVVCEACKILAPPPGVEAMPSALDFLDHQGSLYATEFWCVLVRGPPGGSDSNESAC